MLLSDTRPTRNTISKSFLFGCISGTTTAVLLQPLDRIKTLVQQDEHRGLYRTTKKLIAEDGFAGLWRGLTPSLIRIVPGLSMYFGLIQVTKVYVVNPQTSFEHLSVGFTCRLMTAVVMHPTTVIKTKLESSHYTGQSMTAVNRALWREKGVRGYFAGLAPTLLRDAPFSGLYLMFYRKGLALSGKSEDKITPVIRLTCGMIAGLIACMFTQPFDVLKTTAQLYPHKYPSMLIAARLLYKEAGTRSFLSGFVPRALRRTFTAALNWTVFDELQKHLCGS